MTGVATVRCLSLCALVSLFSLACCTVSPVTTTPRQTTLPAGSCNWNGQVYPNGAYIDGDEYNCTKTECHDGGVVVFDHGMCTGTCNGRTERRLGYCCPICIMETTQTTTPTTTPKTTPPGGCKADDGHVYGNGDEIETDKYRCGGTICQDGQIISWDHQCAFSVPSCPGTSRMVEGQCCPECDLTTIPTTTPSTTPTTTPTTPKPCYIGDKNYTQGQRISGDDPCQVCRCLDNQRWCSDHPIKCNDDVLDCDVRYRPYGECCFTCGSAQLGTTLTWMMVLAMVITRMFQLY